MKRNWSLLAMVNGMNVRFEDNESQGGTTVDCTAQLEKKISRLKKATGKTSFDLWEVI